MLLKNFDYYLPRELVAQEPIKPRDCSRLLVLNKETKKLIHDHFFNIGRYLKKGDVVVLNDSKVIPARLVGRREGKGREIEVFLLKNIDEFRWNCLIGGKKRKQVSDVSFGSSKLKAKILQRNQDGTWRVRFNLSGNKFWQEVMSIGEVPTPPYIKNHKKYMKVKKDFYQTIFAREKGSVAAPTAGFHFTQKLVKELEGRGVKFVFITLHVGLGTFAPIRAVKVEDHRMHAEWFDLSKYTADVLNRAKKEGRRIVAVGTTATRALENCATAPPSPINFNKKDALRSSADERSEGWVNPRLPNYYLKPQSGETKIFITPGYKFKFIDALITNFHLPHSTPLLLAAAFCQNGAPFPKLRRSGAKGSSYGRDLILKAYKEAIGKKYRFYSFGDAMLIL